MRWRAATKASDRLERSRFSTMCVFIACSCAAPTLRLCAFASASRVAPIASATRSCTCIATMCRSSGVARASDDGAFRNRDDGAFRIPHHGSRTTQVAPPKVAEFLLTALATTPRANAMIGDLNERLADEIQKLGRDRAVRLYWARTLHSLWPLLRRAIGKAVKWGAVIAAVRRHF